MRMNVKLLIRWTFFKSPLWNSIKIKIESLLSHIKESHSVTEWDVHLCCVCHKLLTFFYFKQSWIFIAMEIFILIDWQILDRDGKFEFFGLLWESCWLCLKFLYHTLFIVTFRSILINSFGVIYLWCPSKNGIFRP